MTNGNCDDLFSSWLAAREDGGPHDIEELCAEHPECAQTLRAYHAEWLRIEAVNAAGTTPELAATKPEAGPADAGPGPDEAPDPGLLLIPPQSGEKETEAAPLLSRLGKRGPPKERFVVKERIGRGGMGSVFRVYDSEIGRHVAAKVLHLDDPSYLPRFLEEAQTTGQLDHPVFIPVHDFAVDEKGRVFFTMKLVKGVTDPTIDEVRAETFSDVIDKIHAGIEGWTLTRGISDVIVRVAEAMEFAHQKGVIHRDLKPVNILVGRYGEVYVTDFGIARVQGKERAPVPANAIPLTLVRTERREAIERGRETPPSTQSPISPGPTQEGLAIGTPEYMPPEQGEGRLSEIDARSDIYSLGATLYHLIAGVPPWHTPSDHPHRNVIVRRNVSGARPASLHELAPNTPAELLAIVEKAMVREPKHRYASMNAFAADLRAFLEQRVVSAYETGAIAELKKWVQRNPYLTAAAALLVVVLAGSSVVLSLKNQEIQNQKAAVDAKNKEVEAKNAEISTQKSAVEAQKQLADAKIREFDQLAGKVYLERAIEREKDLYPPWPEKIEAMERWLAEDAKRLLDLKPTLESTLADLRARALPLSDAERERDRTTHPQFSELESLRPRLAWLRSRMAALAATSSPALPAIPADFESKTALELNDFAWSRVEPDLTKRSFGKEPLALAAAQRAIAKIEAGDATSELGSTLDTLAWACFANGRDTAAREASARALAVVSEDKKAKYTTYTDNLEKAIAAHSGEAGAKLLADLEAQVAALDAAVNARRTFTFAIEAETFLYTTLSDLAASIAAFESGAKADVEQRLDWAKKIGDLTLRHPNARVTWDEARAAILKADDVVASKLYAQSPGGAPDLEPQMGLVPIGMNPVTKLWEFYELRSACDMFAGQDPAALEIPVHREDGSIEVKDGTGIVFVLLPGGTYLQGAQNTDENAPNYDLGAKSDERLQELSVAPFFLARHELTRAQWYRLSNGEEPSTMSRNASFPSDPPITWTHPVESVDRMMCCELLERQGLTLPTEAHWEYGARAGTTTAWWTGSDAASLAGAANVLDQGAAVPAWGHQEGDFDDGFIGSCRVGSLRANAFGLFDVHGNVWEWCLDDYVSFHSATRAGEGFSTIDAALPSLRIYRGGSFSIAASFARSAARRWNAPSSRFYDLGVRPARQLAIGD